MAVLEMQMFLTELIHSYKVRLRDRCTKETIADKAEESPAVLHQFERQEDVPVFFRPHAPVVQPVWKGQVQMPLKVTRLQH